MQESSSSPAIASSHLVSLSSPVVVLGTEQAALVNDNAAQVAQMSMGEPKEPINTDTTAHRKPAEHGLAGNSQLDPCQGFTCTSSSRSTVLAGLTPNFATSTASEPFKFGSTNRPMTSFVFSLPVANVTNKTQPQTLADSGKSFVFTFDAPQLQTLPTTIINIFSFGGTVSCDASKLFTFGGGGGVSGDVTKPFTFGGGGSVVGDVNKPFAFGTPAVSGAPVIAQDQEAQVDENSARDVQSSDTTSTSLSFSSGRNATSDSFGTQTNRNVINSSPFSFGPSQPPTTNAFPSTVKTDKPINFVQAPSSPFSSSNKVIDGVLPDEPNVNDVLLGPEEKGPFVGDCGVFGQSQASSTPGSPATLFSSGPPTCNSAFTEWIQSASSVGSDSGLLQAATSSSSGFGQSAPSLFSTTSSIGAPAPGAPPRTIRATLTTAPPSAPRRINKLPTRRR